MGTFQIKAVHFYENKTFSSVRNLILYMFQSEIGETLHT